MGVDRRTWRRTEEAGMDQDQGTAGIKKCTEAQKNLSGQVLKGVS